MKTYLSACQKWSNFVITSDPDRHAQQFKLTGGLSENTDLIFCSSLQKALAIIGSGDHNGLDSFVIGGASIYAEALPHADRIYLTTISGNFPSADTFFPEFCESGWLVTHTEHAADSDNPYDYQFKTYVRMHGSL